MQFYFIRHGQSTNNALYDRTGASTGRSEDPPLTEIGRRQAQILAEWLSQRPPQPDVATYDYHNRSGFGFTHLYTSLMLRAVETGQILARRLGLPLVAWREFHEAGGIYLEDEESGECRGLPGKDRSFFERTFPELVLPEALDHHGWWNRPYETDEEAHLRAKKVLVDLTARHGNGDDRVAVISHAGFYNYFMMVLLGCPQVTWVSGEAAEMSEQPSAKAWFLLNNAAISRIDFLEEEVKLVYLNRADFLPDDLIT